jgi:hypothetical protein
MFVNMTPHPVNLLTTEGEEIATFPSKGTIRLDKFSIQIGSLNVNDHEVDLLFSAFNPSDDIPEPVEGTMFIVSALVANAYPERTDFVMVENTVRDDNGRIIGCTAFASVTNITKTQVYAEE